MKLDYSKTLNEQQKEIESILNQLQNYQYQLLQLQEQLNKIKEQNAKNIIDFETGRISYDNFRIIQSIIGGE